MFLSRSVVCSCGVLLVGAGVLKGYALSTEPVLEEGLLTSRWALFWAIQFELALGAWLLSGVRPQFARGVAIGTFALFASVAVYYISTGVESCGCFGSLKVNPWWMLMVDVTMVIALLCSRSFDDSRRLVRPVFFVWPVGMMALVVSWGVWQFESSTVTADGLVDGNSPIVILEPEDWVGKQFPLTKFLVDETGEMNPSSLLKGKWVAVFYQHSCPKCQESLPAYQSRAGDLQSRKQTATALIEVPPFGGPPRTSLGIAHYYRLDGKRDWFVQAPVELELEDGIVRRVSRDHDKEPQSAEVFAHVGL